MKEEIRAYFYVGMTIMLWASVPSVIKFLMGGLSAMQVAFYFLLFGSVALGTVLMLQGRAKQFIHFRKIDYLRFLLLGLLANYLYHLCFNNSLRFISVSEAITLNYLYPIMIVVLASLILKENITKIMALGCLLGFGGLIVAVTGGKITPLGYSINIGLGLVVLAAFCYALFSVLLLAFKYEVITVMFMSIITGLIFVAGHILLFSSLVLPEPKEWIGLAYIGILPLAIGSILWLKAMKIIGASRVAILMYFTPVIGILIAHLAFAENPGLYLFLGMGMIIGGNILSNLKRSRKK